MTPDERAAHNAKRKKYKYTYNSARRESCIDDETLTSNKAEHQSNNAGC